MEFERKFMRILLGEHEVRGQLLSAALRNANYDERRDRRNKADMEQSYTSWIKQKLTRFSNTMYGLIIGLLLSSSTIVLVVSHELTKWSCLLALATAIISTVLIFWMIRFEAISSWSIKQRFTVVADYFQSYCDTMRWNAEDELSKLADAYSARVYGFMTWICGFTVLFIDLFQNNGFLQGLFRAVLCGDFQGLLQISYVGTFVTMPVTLGLITVWFFLLRCPLWWTRWTQQYLSK